MKRIFILLAVLAMAACNSGRSNAELEALSGMNVNDTLTRVDLVKMDIARQREIFNALSPEKKSDLYRYKIYKDIKNNEFTKEERAEMTGLLKKVSPEIYTSGKDKFDRFSQEFEGRMLRDLGWDDQKLFKYTMTIMTGEEFREYLLRE
ncbi:MAG: hypothetical protein NC115_02470 [Bacteroidales bacterium]|nr:hypothetical protein [Bacteroidales bacterium]